MVRVSFTPRERVGRTDYSGLSLVQEYRFEFEAGAYRLLETADSPTEYDESVHTIEVGNDIVHVAIKVKATKR